MIPALSAQQVLDALANTPNGVIISVEQAEKYNAAGGAKQTLDRLAAAVESHAQEEQTR